MLSESSLQTMLNAVTLWKIPELHLISWFKNFMERHNFRIVLEITQNCVETVSFHKISTPGNYSGILCSVRDFIANKNALQPTINEKSNNYNSIANPSYLLI